MLSTVRSKKHTHFICHGNAKLEKSTNIYCERYNKKTFLKWLSSFMPYMPFCIFDSVLKFVKHYFKNVSNESYNLILFVRELSIIRVIKYIDLTFMA